jgi:hypothetical protein
VDGLDALCPVIRQRRLAQSEQKSRRAGRCGD